MVVLLKLLKLLLSPGFFELLVILMHSCCAEQACVNSGEKSSLGVFSDTEECILILIHSYVCSDMLRLPEGKALIHCFKLPKGRCLFGTLNPASWGL